MNLKNGILGREKGQTSFPYNFQSIAKELAGLELTP